MVTTGILCCLAGTAFAEWQEKEIIPAEYEKIEYIYSENFFWLFSPGEKTPSQYHQVGDKTRIIPLGKEVSDYYLKSVELVGEDLKSEFHKPAISVEDTSNRKMKSWIDLEGQVVAGPIETKEILGAWSDGYYSTSEGIYTGSELIIPTTKVNRINKFENGWKISSSNQIVNEKNEVLFELPDVENFEIYNKEILRGQLNGVDKKSKVYRLWDWDKEDITPVETGFVEVTFLLGMELLF